jgi:hypothetical protein
LLKCRQCFLVITTATNKSSRYYHLCTAAGSTNITGSPPLPPFFCSPLPYCFCFGSSQELGCKGGCTVMICFHALSHGPLCPCSSHSPALSSASAVTPNACRTSPGLAEATPNLAEASPAYSGNSCCRRLGAVPPMFQMLEYLIGHSWRLLRFLLGLLSALSGRLGLKTRSDIPIPLYRHLQDHRRSHRCFKGWNTSSVTIGACFASL